jgi:WD40 repeat protein
MVSRAEPPREVQAENRLFISYSRVEGAFVRHLFEGLTVRGVDAWVDWEDIPPSAEWMVEIERGIDSADAFVFVISPSSLASKVCAQELEHAIAAGKRLIPVLHAEVPGLPMPEELARLNWIFARREDELPAALERLVQALTTDLAALRLHARLLLRAREWIGAARDSSFLLRGADLEDAQQWLGAIGAAGPMPTAEQIEYLQASQQGQREEMERWRSLYQRALARQLAAQSELLRGQSARELETSVLLATESLRREVSLEGLQVLQKGLALLPPCCVLDNILSDQGINETLPAADGRTLCVARDDGCVSVIDVASGAETLRLGVNGPAQELSQSIDGAVLACMVHQSREVRVWSLPAGTERWCFTHGSWVGAIALRPDGALLATADAGGAYLFDLADGRALRTLETGGTIESLAFSPDGHWLATGGRDGITCAWDADTGALSWQHEHGAAVVSLAFSPDGQQLASAGWDGHTRLFEVASGAERHRIAHETVATDTHFSRDGRLVASQSDDGTLVVIDTVTGRTRMRVAPEGGVLGSTFSPDGHWIASRGLDSSAQVWEVATGHEVAGLPGDAIISALAFIDTTLWMGSRDGRLRGALLDIWPLRHGERLACAAFSADGTRIAKARGDGHVSVGAIDANSPQLALALNSEPEWMQLGNGGSFMVTQEDFVGHIEVWDLGAGERLWTRRATDCGYYGHDLVQTVLDPGDRWLTVQESQGDTLEVISTKTGALQMTAAHESVIMGAAFAPEGDRLVTIGGTKALVSAIADGRRTLLDHPGDVLSGAFSPDGKHVATTCDDGRLRLWDAESGALVQSLEHDEPPAMALAFSPDGTVLATSDPSSVNLWRIADGQRLMRAPVDGTVGFLAFSLDGAYVAAGSRDGRARIWEVESGTEAARIAHDGEVFGVQFDASGRWCLVEHMQGATRYRTAWLWRPGDLLKAAAAALPQTRVLTPKEWQRYLGDEPMPESASRGLRTARSE